MEKLRIQVLSTMLADRGLGEWGFAALVEADGRRILFDTGARPDTVLQNARELRVDLSNVTDVILSHNHQDHTGGLMTLRKDVMARNPEALSRAHVGKGMFADRGTAYILKMKPEYEAAGGKFVEHEKPVEIAPGVWLTGVVPRPHPERNWSGSSRIRTTDGMVEDNLPEDMSLVIVTAKGLVVLAGCGHAGIVNTLEHARKTIRDEPVHAAIGGFHLFQANDETLRWTARKLREFGTGSFLGAHCTGIEATYKLRELLGLGRKAASVAAVGAVFELGKDMDPGAIAR
ncbi:MAG: MBL fold metallo-hydrolase [Bryobacteraceae bacterium]|nr:MBL fold metallo-hydrolase [Bryobacteraceae bacterium]